MRVNGQLVSDGPFKPPYVAELIQRNKTDATKVHRNKTDSVKVHRNKTDSIKVHRNKTDAIKVHRNKTDAIKVSADEMCEKYLQRLSRLHISHGCGHLN